MKPRWLNRTVVALSATSFFSDVSHEMGTAVLPLFLKSLAGGAAALGLIEGIAEFVMALGKLYGGTIGDRLERKKWATGGGYLLTWVGIGSYVFAHAWWHLLLGRSVAWFGRGYRGPLRDALMADAADPANYGKAFGLERAGDYAGAFVGPLISAYLLWLWVPVGATPEVLNHALRLILALVLVPGACSWLCVWLVVQEQRHVSTEAHRRLFTRLGEMPGPFKRYLLAVGCFSLGDFSNTMLIFWAANSSVAGGYAGRNITPILLYAGYNAVSTVVTYAAGSLSDRYGRRGLLIAGYVAAVVAAFMVATGSTTMAIMMAVFALNGIAMGNKDAVEKAYAADFLGGHERALGFGTLALVTGIGKLIASALIGALWSTLGVRVAFVTAGALSTVGVVLLVGLTRRSALPQAA
jgi:MFS family permease